MSRKRDHAIALYMEGIRDGKVRHAVEAYTGERYTQHSTGVRDGVEGFVEFFEPFIARNPAREIRVVRALEDGPHVFLHAYQNINAGRAEWVTTDFFDTDTHDKIVEHWDVIAPYARLAGSGGSSTDGPTDVRDLDQTEANKAIVRSLFTEALLPGGDERRARHRIAEHCLHHAATPAGPGVFGTRKTYEEVVLLVGEGNYVTGLSRASRDGEQVAHVDLVRLDGGRIVEHWENREPVPPRT